MSNSLASGKMPLDDPSDKNLCIHPWALSVGGGSHWDSDKQSKSKTESESVSISDVKSETCPLADLYSFLLRQMVTEHTKLFLTV